MTAKTKGLVDFFTRSLSSFQASKEHFRVLCTVARDHAQTAASHPSPPSPSPRPSSTPVRQIIVLDSSFNPPTVAHAQMARSAIEASVKAGSKLSSHAKAVGSTRLVLLLAVNNADKAAKPASFPVRLGMMDSFGRGLLGDVAAGTGSGSSQEHGGLDEAGGLEIDVAVTTMPYFHDKAAAMLASGFYGTDANTEMTVLVGYDTLIRILNPKYYVSQDSQSSSEEEKREAMRRALEPFFSRSKLRVTMRPDDDWGGREEQREYVAKMEKEKWLKGRIELVEGMSTGEVVSSSVVSSSKVRQMVMDGDVDRARRFVGDGIGGWITDQGLYRNS